jgi:hypothetical protein
LAILKDNNMTIENETTGTARTLHEMSEYEMLEYDYGSETALSVTTKAMQRNFPEITRENVEGFVIVTRATRTGDVNIAEERQHMEDQAQRAVDEMLSNVSVNETEIVFETETEEA